MLSLMQSYHVVSQRLYHLYHISVIRYSEKYYFIIKFGLYKKEKIFTKLKDIVVTGTHHPPPVVIYMNPCYHNFVLLGKLEETTEQNCCFGMKLLSLGFREIDSIYHKSHFDTPMSVHTVRNLP